MNDDIMTNVWAAAEREYLSGSTAQEICACYNIGRSAFFARARAGGWRKCDQSASEEDVLAYDVIEPPDATPPPARTRYVMAQEALDRSDKAMRRGRLREAQGWARLAADYRRPAREEAYDGSWATVERSAREVTAQADRPGAHGPDSDRPESDGTSPAPSKPANPCEDTTIQATPDCPDDFYPVVRPAPALDIAASCRDLIAEARGISGEDEDEDCDADWDDEDDP